jgi:hypothetical protein
MSINHYEIRFRHLLAEGTADQISACYNELRNCLFLDLRDMDAMGNVEAVKWYVREFGHIEEWLCQGNNLSRDYVMSMYNHVTIHDCYYYNMLLRLRMYKEFQTLAKRVGLPPIAQATVSVRCPHTRMFEFVPRSTLMLILEDPSKVLKLAGKGHTFVIGSEANQVVDVVAANRDKFFIQGPYPSIDVPISTRELAMLNPKKYTPRPPYSYSAVTDGLDYAFVGVDGTVRST